MASPEIVTNSPSRTYIVESLGISNVIPKPLNRDSGMRVFSGDISHLGLVAHQKFLDARNAGLTNGGVVGSYKTLLYELDMEDHPVSPLVTTGNAFGIGNQLHETLKNGGLVVANSISISQGNSLSIETTTHKIPLKQMRLDEIIQSLSVDSNNVSLELQGKHRSLLELDALTKQQQLNLLMAVGGVAPEHVSSLLTFGSKSERLPLFMLSSIDEKEVNEVKNSFIPKLFRAVEYWSQARPMKQATDLEESRIIARRMLNYAAHEAFELVFESQINTDNPNWEELLQKEAADVFIFLAQALINARYSQELDQSISIIKDQSGWIPGNLDDLGLDWKQFILGQSMTAEEAIRYAFMHSQNQWIYHDEWREEDETALIPGIVNAIDLLIRYGLVKGWDYESILQKTIERNSFNYPRYIFENDLSPMPNAQSATIFSRFLRKAHVHVEHPTEGIKQITGLEYYHLCFPGDIQNIIPNSIERADMRYKISSWSEKVLLHINKMPQPKRKYNEYAKNHLNTLHEYQYDRE